MQISRLLLSVFICAAARSGDPRDFFETAIRPLLAKNCFACHTSSHLGGLEMKSRETLLKGGNSGPAIVPGNPEASLLLRVVNHTHERLKMPPQGKLKPEEVEALAVWVKTGAYWPEEPAVIPTNAKAYVITPEQRAFWAFQSIHKACAAESQTGNLGEIAH